MDWCIIQIYGESIRNFEKKTLIILDQLDHFLDHIILYGHEELKIKKGDAYELRPNNMSFAGLDEPEDIYLVEKFLQSKDINFKIDFDFLMKLLLVLLHLKGN
jgi:hypothetical protein